MARRKKHEDHQNHEAWAIPYGDLITLLLAFFVVMYSMSSVNEGKYRILSDSLVAAFRGSPKAITPIQVGEKPKSTPSPASKLASPAAVVGAQNPALLAQLGLDGQPQKPSAAQSGPGGGGSLERMADAVRSAMQGLIELGDVRIRESARWLEVEVNTDILFASGDARVSLDALPVIQQLAAILAPFPNPIRVEGHTDNVPIRTAVYPSNWELSAGRAANVVQLLTHGGVDPGRLQIIGLGEYRPVAANDSAEGRNRNRRVVIVVLDAPQDEGDYLREHRDTGDEGTPPAPGMVTQEAAPGEAAPPLASTARLTGAPDG
jgi:chemotaxis protein MotB